MPFQLDAEIEALVARFEAATLAPEAFGHEAHVAVGLWYLAHAPYPEAVDRMRTGLQHFLAHHGVATGYHETLTVFWMRVLACVTLRDAHLPLSTRVNDVLARYPGRATIAAHYRPETVFSGVARTRWVAPDLLPLPGPG